MRLIAAVAIGWFGLSIMAGVMWCAVLKAFPPYRHYLCSYESRAELPLGAHGRTV